MSAMLELIKDRPVQRFSTGEIVIKQGANTNVMFVLLEGAVEVLRDEIRVAKASQPGIIFGEMSVLLGGPPTATVRALAPSSFAVIDQPRSFLLRSPEASLFVAELLANRLDALNKYLIDVKRQYEGHDHLGMIDDVLETLLHRPKR